jgi:DNA repair exonuclease SbcCD ATPase subunit
MRLEFGSLVIRDFKAFKGRHSLALNGVGVVYIVGDNKETKRLYGNGAAKSTIWDALCWCFYGKTPLGLRNNDVKPWSGGKPSVTVCLTIEGKDCVVQRTTSPNLFTIDGEEKPDISSVLPISFELFVNTILLPQEKSLFLDRTPSDKMELFSEAIYLDRWDLRSTAAGTAATELSSELESLKRDKTLAEGALDEVADLLGATREKSQAWQASASGRTQTSKGDLAALQKRLAVADKALAGAVLSEDSTLTEKRASESQLSKLRRELASIEGSISRVSAKILVAKEKYIELEAELDIIDRAKNCPTCGQPIKKSMLADHKKHIEDQCGTLQASDDTYAAEIAQYKREKDETQKRVLTVEQEIDAFQDKADDAHDVILRLKPEVETLKAQIVAAQAVKEEVNPHLAQVKALRDREKALKNEVASYDVDIKEGQKQYEQIRFWVKGFKDIKLQLIEEVLEELEIVANGMIEEVGLDNWEIRFDIEKESKTGNIQRKINVEVSSPESKGFVRWESWSGGERQRLRLIGSLALADVLLGYVGIDTNLEVLDEPAVYWSSEGVQELCAFLATRAKERKKTIMYIEHQAVESTHFDEVVTVVKDKGGARIT